MCGRLFVLFKSIIGEFLDGIPYPYNHIPILITNPSIHQSQAGGEGTAKRNIVRKGRDQAKVIFLI